MKKLRLTTISVFAIFLMATAANAGNYTVGKDQNVIYMSLTEAVQNPGLLSAMYAQINQGFMAVNKLTYTVNVKYQGYVIKISGTREQWNLFFIHWKIVGANTTSISDVSPK